MKPCFHRQSVFTVTSAAATGYWHELYLPWFLGHCDNILSRHPRSQGKRLCCCRWRFAERQRVRLCRCKRGLRLVPGVRRSDWWRCWAWRGPSASWWRDSFRSGRLFSSVTRDATGWRKMFWREISPSSGAFRSGNAVMKLCSFVKQRLGKRLCITHCLHGKQQQFEEIDKFL